MLSCQNPSVSIALVPSASDLWDNECEYVFLSLAVCPAVGQWQPEEDGLLSLRTSASVNFETVSTS